MRSFCQLAAFWNARILNTHWWCMCIFVLGIIHLGLHEWLLLFYGDKLWYEVHISAICKKSSDHVKCYTRYLACTAASYDWQVLYLVALLNWSCNTARSYRILFRQYYIVKYNIYICESHNDSIAVKKKFYMWLCKTVKRQWLWVIT